MTAPRAALSLTLALLLAAPAFAGPKPTAIKKAFKSGNAGQVKDMLKALHGELSDKKTVTTVLKNAPRLKSLGVYPELVEALKTVEGEGLAELIKNYKKQKKGEMRFLVVDALGQVDDAEAEKTLAKAITEDKDSAVRVRAARLLAQRYTISAVDALIPALTELEQDPKEERMTREVISALRNLTGQEISVAEDWVNYWNAHKNSYKKPEDLEDGKTKTKGLMERMKKDRPAELKTLTRMKSADLIVVDGNDAVDKVLKVLDLKYEKIKREEYEKREFDPEKQLLIFECPGSRNVLTEAGIKKLHDFVAGGGYAFCSDWDAGKTLALAFPKVVTFLRETPRGEEATDATIEPYPQTRDHPLMRDVFPLNTWDGRGLEWKLHERSHLIDDRKSAVIPLVACPQTKEFGSMTVAFTFAYTAEGGGRPVTGASKKLKKAPGRVLFVSSHFKDEAGGDKDGYALQQLLLNFILEKQEQKKNRR